MNTELQSDPNAAEPLASDSPSTSTEVIVLGKGLTKELLFNERIIVYTLDTVDRRVLDAGADDIMKTLSTWREGHPYLAVYDIRSAKIALTPHMRHRLQELSKAFPERKGRSAVILPRSVITQVFKLFVRALNRHGRSKQVFFDRDSAIEWLKEMMVEL